MDISSNKGKFFFYKKNLLHKLQLFVKKPQTLGFYAGYYLSREAKETPHLQVVSYPKSGRTWLEELLLTLFLKEHELERGNYRTLRDLKKDYPDLPLVDFTHAGGSWESLLHDESDVAELNADAWVRGNRKIFLYRDPRDVLASSYHHMRSRNGISEIQPRDLIENPVVGVRKLVRYMNVWRDWAERQDDAILVRYEDLKENGVSELSRIVRHMQIDCRESSVADAVEDCQFEKMRAREAASKGDNPWLTPADAKDPNSFKVRAGKSGEIRKILSEHENRKLDEIIREELNPRFEYDSPR